MGSRIITIHRGTRKEPHWCTTLSATQFLAKKCAKELRGGDVVALSGELGAGKTAFVQSLGRALGVKRHIPSPTFVLMNMYTVSKKIHGITQLCHIDAYRLKSAEELKTIGVEEYLGEAGTLTIIEWPEKIKKLLPKNTIWISFEISDTV